MGISVPTTPGSEGFILQVSKVASTSNVALSGLQTIDGVTLTAEERVLLLGQSSGSQNGPWVAASGSWTRPHDYAAGSVVKSNIVVPVSSGSTNADTRWQITTDGNITVDTTSTAWGKTDLGLVAVVDDTNPSLGGNLDLNNKTVKNGAGTVFSVDASANVTFNQNVSISGTVNMPATTTLPNTGDGAITTEASAADANGKPISIEAGSTTAGGTNDTGTGGDITLKPGAGKGSATGGDVIIQTAPAGGSGTTVNNYSTQMIVKESGNVGMGTTGPDRKLDILDASNPQLRVSQADGSVYTDVQAKSTGGVHITPTGGTYAGHTFLKSGSASSYLVVQNSTTTLTDDRSTGLSMGVGGDIAYIWNRGTGSNGSIYLGVAQATAIAIVGNNAHNEVKVTRLDTTETKTASLCYRPNTIEHSSGTLGLTMVQSAATVLLSGGDVELPNGAGSEINALDLGTQYVVVNTTAANIASAVTVAGADKFYDNSNTGGVTAAQQVDAMKAKTFILIGYDSGTTEAKWLVVG